MFCMSVVCVHVQRVQQIHIQGDHLSINISYSIQMLNVIGEKNILLGVFRKEERIHTQMLHLVKLTNGQQFGHIRLVNCLYSNKLLSMQICVVLSCG